MPRHFIHILDLRWMKIVSQQLFSFFIFGGLSCYFIFYPASDIICIFTLSPFMKCV
uniref:Uncharacterized protein n=1 Tax=Rhizophora mucronata TaxID=61149 RepID=A0A2P2LS38_RHIMU